VDDDPDILATVGDVLEMEGYEVERALNGADALEVLDRASPSLVILDIRMPVVDGWEFARTVKDRGIQVAILVMTAAQDSRRWANEIDAAGYIAKPFDLDDLLAAVARLHTRL
jgi:DNA-binding response OmpR family regulator